jgi:cytochrome b6-f complex iron-sulfur subunit
VDATYLITATVLAGVVSLLAAARLLGLGAPAPLRPASARPDLPWGVYASARAPGSEPGPATRAPVAEPSAAGTELEPRLDPVSRRKLLRWVGWTTILVILGELAAAFLPFFWPRKVGAFGGTIAAGTVNDYQVGEVKKIVEGKFYLSRVPEGFLALWQKCPHLGCTVPWQANDRSEDSIAAAGRFNCPCHGSIYDRYGQIITGPAPRPMDAFPLSVRDGRIFVETGPDKALIRTTGDPKQGIGQA